MRGSAFFWMKKRPHNVYYAVTGKYISLNLKKLYSHCRQMSISLRAKNGSRSAEIIRENEKTAQKAEKSILKREAMENNRKFCA